MAITSHGHHIPATVLTEDEKVASKARCGGPGMCGKCSREACDYLYKQEYPITPKHYTNDTGVVVEAVQMTTENAPQVAEWTSGKHYIPDENMVSQRIHPDSVRIPTFHGTSMRAFIGDYVIKAETGIFYAIPERFFVDLYVEVVEPEVPTNTLASEPEPEPVVFPDDPA